jgi:uncharacterized membrane protein YfcA
MALGLVLKLVLGRITREEAAAGRRSSRRRVAAAPRASPPRPPESPAVATVRKRPLTAFMLACAGIGVPLMVVFESAPTRIIGVLSLFAFIVSGVFLIADPSALGRDED